MAKFNLSTAGTTYIVGRSAEAAREYDANLPADQRAQKRDGSGRPLVVMQLVALGDDGAELMRVESTTDPGVAQGTSVRVEGLTATTWEVDGRSGISYRAESITALNARADKVAA
jgi:hypothetical protein